MRIHLNIGQRLALGFSLLVLLVVATVGIGVLYTVRMEETVDTTREGVIDTRNIAALQLSWSVVVGTIDNMLLTRQVGLIDQRLNPDLVAFNDQLATLKDQTLASSEHEAFASDLEALGEDLTAVAAEVAVDAQAGRWATAQVLRHTDLATVQRRFNESLDTLNASIAAEIEDSIQSTNNTSDNLRVTWLVIVVFAIIGGAFIAYRTIVGITNPIGELVHAAESIERGDRAQRVEATTQDEIGHLARVFNTMTGQLDELIGTLEARVEERTHDMQIAAQVSERIANILNPDELLPQVVELTKDGFGLYHVHIYLYDADQRHLVLAQGAGDAGRVMKNQGHRIPATARSLVAQSGRERRAVIVNDVAADPNFLANPLLPYTRAEAALPLAVGDRVLGVLDVQSDQTERFDEDLLTVFTTFAGQIAVALDNARLFSEMQRASRQDQVLGALTQEIQRATSIDDVLRSAARELGKALRVPETAIELHLPTDDSSARVE